MTAAKSDSNTTDKGIFLGFDFGEKKIGAAIGDGLTGGARPLPTIRNGRQPDWDSLAKLLKQWRPAGCVVGLPVNLDGEEQKISVHARAFATQLRIRFGVPVYLADERLSSRSADAELREARADGRLNRRVQPGDRDGVAARLILEQWLNDPASKALMAKAVTERPAKAQPVGESAEAAPETAPETAHQTAHRATTTSPQSLLTAEPDAPTRT